MSQTARQRDSTSPDGTTSLLYVDDPDSQPVVAQLSGVTDECTVDTAADVPAACEALDAGSYDCVVADLAVGDRSPGDVARVLSRAGDAPLVAYTDVAAVDLSEETLDSLTTLVTRGDDAHRRFLRTTVEGVISEVAATERTRLERARELFDESVSVFVRSSTGTVVHASRQLTDLAGVEQADAGEPLPVQLETVFSNGREVRDRFEAAGETGTVDGYVGTLAGPDGEQRYVACWSLPLGEYRLDVLRDVTAVVDRREELEKLETLVELSHDGLYTTSPSGVIEYCNWAFAEMLGYDHDDLVGQPLARLLEPESLREGQRAVQQLVEHPDQPSRVIEQTFRREDGGTIPLSTRSAVRTREDETFGGLVNVARDARGRKGRERALERQRETLREENEHLKEIVRTVGEDFRELLAAAERSLAADGPIDFDRTRTALGRVADQIDDIIEMTRDSPPEETDLLAEFLETSEGHFEPDSLEGPEDYHLSYRESSGGEFEDPTAVSAGEDTSTTESGAVETDERLQVLHVDGDHLARQRVAAVVEPEPDIAYEGVGTAEAALRTLGADSSGCLVVDFETLGVDLSTFEERVRETAPDVPLVVFTNEPTQTVYERFVDENATVVEKGDETNRAFLVEKVRSLTDIGQPGEVDIAWQSGRAERTGDPGDVLAVVCADGEAVTTSGDPTDFFESDAVSRDRFHDQLSERVAGDEFPPTGTTDTVYELPDEGESRLLRCWRLPLPADLPADAVEVYRDVTAEFDRHERLQRARTLVENARDGIEVLDSNAEVVYCNETFAAFFGYDREELLGRNLTQHFEPESLRRGQQAVQDLLEDPEMNYVVQDLDHRTRSGEPFTLSYNYTLTPLDEDGSYTGIMCVARDVTERKQRERELRRQRLELGRKNELLENFSVLFCHELRNPLTIAQNYLELADTRDDESYLAEVRDGVDRMQEIVDELLAFVRMGEEIETTEPVDLPERALAVWDRVESGDAQLHLSSQGETHLECAPERLDAMLECLFRNALEHAGEEATVRLEARPDGFAVADDGPGIPPEKRDEIFDYIYSDEREYGLGLVIVRDVARAHGWTITVGESDDGGARFEVRTD